MCVMSMVMDHKYDEWQKRLGPFVYPNLPNSIQPWPGNPFVPPTSVPTITKEEIDEFRRLLDRAREYDKNNNEPDCEMESKKDKIRDLAKELGVDVSFI